MFLLKIFMGILYTLCVLVGIFIILHVPSIAFLGYLGIGLGLIMIYISGLER